MVMQPLQGVAIFRYQPDLGWQVFDWIPRTWPALSPVSIIHDRHGNPSLLRLQGQFIAKPRKGRFCKRPHRLIAWQTDTQ